MSPQTLAEQTLTIFQRGAPGRRAFSARRSTCPR